MREETWNIAYQREDESVSELAVAQQKLVSQQLLTRILEDSLRQKIGYATRLEHQVQMWRNLCIAAATLSVFICAMLHMVMQ